MRVRLAAVLVATLVPAGVACRRDSETSPSTTSVPVTTAEAIGTSSTSLSVAPSTHTPTTTGVPSTTAPTTTTTTSSTTAITSTTSTTTGPTTAASTTRPPSTTAVSTTRPSTTIAVAPAVVIDRGTSGRHEVALTFDAGSDVGFAADILDLLAAEGIRASFGMTGSWAQANPELVARMAADGHVLMNHTQTHPYMTDLSTADRLAELAAADAAVAAITGQTMQPYYRPPFGDSDASVLADIARAGYRYSVTWTIDSLGWQGLAPADVTQRCLDRAVDGAIVLMHVGSQSTDAAALPDVIAGLRADGYAFVTITQLLS